MSPDSGVQHGHASQSVASSDGDIPQQRETRRARGAEPASIDQPASPSALDASETHQDQLGNAAFDYASYQDVAQATQPMETAHSSTLGAVSVDVLGHQGNLMPNPNETTSGLLEDDLFTSIWDTQLFSLPWMHNFDLSTTAFSAVHTAQPLWPMSTDIAPSGSQYLHGSHLRQSTDPHSLAEDFGRTLPNPGSTGSRKSLEHGRPPVVSFLDRIFSRRISPEPEKLPRVNPVARRNLPRISGKLRNHLKTQLEPFHYLLPKDFVLPSQHALSRYVSAYFEGFHLHLPFIHVPTWSPTSCHLGLLIAICSLGAKYCFEQQTAVALWDAGRLVVRAATEERNEELDGANSGRIEICQAMLLLMAFQTWSGNSFGLRQALSFQSALAGVSNIAYSKASSHC